MAPTKNIMVASFLAVVLVATSIMLVVEAAEKMVGGEGGWKLKPTDENFFNEWADDNDIKVGDTLVFEFPKGQHDVAEVSKEAYKTCDSSDPLKPVRETSPVNIEIESAGERYFICTVDNHCKVGMKMKVDADGRGDADGPGDADSPNDADGPGDRDHDDNDSSSGSGSSSSSSGSKSDDPDDSDDSPDSSGSASSAPPAKLLFVVFFFFSLFLNFFC